MNMIASQKCNVTVITDVTALAGYGIFEKHTNILFLDKCKLCLSLFLLFFFV